MPKLKSIFVNEQGVVHLLVPMILLVGIIAGTYLVLEGPKIFKPKAYEAQSSISGPVAVKLSPCPPIGDVDNNGYVTNADAEAVLKIVAKLDPYKNPTADQLRRANVDTRNNNVTSVDALVIKRYVGGLDNTFRACTPQTSPSPTPVATPTPLPSPTTPYIRITYPNGGEVFTIGETKRITWSSQGTSSCDLIFSPSGSTATIRISSIWNPAIGYYDWLVGWGYNSGTQGKIQMQCSVGTSGGFVYDQSDAPFTINPGTLPSPTPVAGKRVFISDLTYPPTSLRGGFADRICQSNASSYNLGGTWKAWVSYNNSSVASRLNHYNGSYKLLNGTIVANNWTDLTDGTLQNPINQASSGRPNINTDVWTGTTTNGSTASQNCSDWSTTLGFGITGNSSSKYDGWTGNQYTYKSCADRYPIYCFEQ